MRMQTISFATFFTD